MGLSALGFAGIPLALLGAVLLSAGSFVQQRGVGEVGRRDDGKGGLAVRQLLKLVVDRRWLLGTGLVVGAIACQLAALALSPIAVVQPIGVFALVITSLITARSTGQGLRGGARRAVAICVVAVVLFVTVAALTTRMPPVRTVNVVVVLIIAAAVVVLIGGAFLALRRRLGRIFYVLASGVLFGFVATFAKVILGRVETVVQAGRSPFDVGVLTYVCLLGIVVAGSLGQYLQQSAFSSGSPEVVVAGLTVIDPIVGASIGLAVLGEAGGAPLWAFAVFIVAGVAAVLGVVQLSRAQPGG